jgi:50S ribosomal protein L16 3-hydroxylase
MAQFSSTDAFWDDFVENYWNKKPTVIRHFKSPILSPKETVQGVLKRIEELGANFASETYFRSEHMLFQVGLEEMLPTQNDPSISDYILRISRDQLKGAGFAITINNVQTALGFDKWNEFRHFLGGLYSRVGVPTANAELVLFAGNSVNTQRGVHRDTAHVFQFVLEGKKRIRAWPFEQFEGPYYIRKVKEDYQPYIDSSICLDGEPGDILYWPVSYWHVGESEGGKPDSALSLAVHYGGSIIRNYGADLQANLELAVNGMDKTESIPLSSLKAVAGAVKNLLPTIERQNNEKHAELRVMKQLLTKLSGYAFFSVPPPRLPREFGPDEKVVTDPRYPILLHQVDDMMIVSATGHTATLIYRRELEKVVEALNTGKPQTLSGLVRSTGADPEEVGKFLVMLGAYRAINSV